MKKGRTEGIRIWIGLRDSSEFGLTKWKGGDGVSGSVFKRREKNPKKISRAARDCPPFPQNIGGGEETVEGWAISWRRRLRRPPERQ